MSSFVTCYNSVATQHMKRFFALTYKVTLYLFAAIGVTTTGVFLAMQFDLLSVRGSIDDRNQYFLEAYRQQQSALHTAKNAMHSQGRLARVTTEQPNTEVVASEVLEQSCLDAALDTCTWDQTTEWMVIKAALAKDVEVLKRVEVETGVPARIIAAVVVPEQARFFSSNREVFKRWFEPMKLLGSLSQFSLGVSGIKQETARQIESFVNEPNSVFYPGEGMTELITYPADGDRDALLFDRLTDEKDHYYSYLYTALFIKEVVAQWERAGFGSKARPEILVTLFNLGFAKSLPNANPVAGGATLHIGNIDYTYGTLGGLFYYSQELRAELPAEKM